MKLPYLIDFHMHSTVSDGTDPPEALLQRVRAAGIGHFSLTDHDAVQGCARILAVRKSDDPRFLPGVEFSCRDEAGKYHILGYGYDPESKPIQSVVAFGHDLRMKKVRMRLEHLQERFGFSFPEQEIQSLLSQDNPGKPHIGNLPTPRRRPSRSISTGFGSARIPSARSRRSRAFSQAAASPCWRTPATAAATS